MTTIDAYTGLLPARNSEIHLVRWVRKGDEWAAETILATYLSCANDHWFVRINRRELLLPCDQWQIFAM